MLLNFQSKRVIDNANSYDISDYYYFNKDREINGR